jgi:hypothetical protein
MPNQAHVLQIGARETGCDSRANLYGQGLGCHSFNELLYEMFLQMGMLRGKISKCENVPWEEAFDEPATLI